MMSLPGLRPRLDAPKQAPSRPSPFSLGRSSPATSKVYSNNPASPTSFAPSPVGRLSTSIAAGRRPATISSRRSTAAHSGQRLASTGRADELARRHAEWFADITCVADAELRTAGEAAAQATSTPSSPSCASPVIGHSTMTSGSPPACQPTFTSTRRPASSTSRCSGQSNSSTGSPPTILTVPSSSLRPPRASFAAAISPTLADSPTRPWSAPATPLTRYQLRRPR